MAVMLMVFLELLLIVASVHSKCEPLLEGEEEGCRSTGLSIVCYCATRVKNFMECLERFDIAIHGVQKCTGRSTTADNNNDDDDNNNNNNNNNDDNNNNDNNNNNNNNNNNDNNDGDNNNNNNHDHDHDHDDDNDDDDDFTCRNTRRCHSGPNSWIPNYNNIHLC
ncbi:unnamed protein product [Nippostrongylus brasiliensis]|uniref:Secreted protein n=1 Tax=Nippostrongylus brasiliensis TaxID=27835 RepID=A0A0N4Y1G9_NIPBR|nr:unnamed protein product [Nippostrongylus brasiliensis]